MNILERFAELEKQFNELKNRIEQTQTSSTGKEEEVYSSQGSTNRIQSKPIDISSGLIPQFSGGILWNDSESNMPAIGTILSSPTEGYNKHSHSKFSGGALVNGLLEIVEYDLTQIDNKESQQFWKSNNSIVIKTTVNSKGEEVSMIGKLNFTFNPNTLSWGVPAVEIDVQNCYLVKRRTEAVIDEETGNSIEGKEIGTIETDSKGQEMKSPLYVTDESGEVDITKTSVIWDENGKCWRFIAVYAYEPEA